MKRGLSTRTAIAFDIDGVFKYGREWSPDGLAALQKVSAAGMPFVFVTNGGGGLTEATYGTHLKDKVVAAGDASTASGGGSSGARGQAHGALVHAVGVPGVPESSG